MNSEFEKQKRQAFDETRTLTAEINVTSATVGFLINFVKNAELTKLQFSEEDVVQAAKDYYQDNSKGKSDGSELNINGFLHGGSRYARFVGVTPELMEQALTDIEKVLPYFMLMSEHTRKIRNKSEQEFEEAKIAVMTLIRNSVTGSNSPFNGDPSVFNL